GRILENYHEEARCLILGYVTTAASSPTPLHVLCDHSNKDAVDIVTPYIPQNHGGEQKQNGGESSKSVDAKPLHGMWRLVEKICDYARVRTRRSSRPHIRSTRMGLRKVWRNLL